MENKEKTFNSYMFYILRDVDGVMIKFGMARTEILRK